MAKLQLHSYSRVQELTDTFQSTKGTQTGTNVIEFDVIASFTDSFVL